MPEKSIVVIGVTGTQGGSVARLFAKEPGWKVRGITRNISKPSNGALKDQGIELVQADLDDPASLEGVCGSECGVLCHGFPVRIDLYADILIRAEVCRNRQFIGNASVIEEAKASGRRLNEVACEREVQQGKNIIDAVSKLTLTLDRFVLSMLSNSDRMTQGKIKWNLHFDGKGRYTDYLKQTYPDLAAKTSYLYIGVYLDTWKNPVMRPAKQQDGTFILQTLRNQGTLPVPPTLMPKPTPATLSKPSPLLRSHAQCWAAHDFSVL